MNFDFSEDQKLLKQTARDYLEEHAPLTACREVLESNQSHSDALWKGAAELGWLGAVIPEEYGGAGFGYLELAVIAEEVGRALAPIPFGPSVYLAAEAILHCGSDEQKQKYLPRLAAGEWIGTFATSEATGQNGFGDFARIRFLRASDQVQLGGDTQIDMAPIDADWISLTIPVVPEAIGETVLIEWIFTSDSSLDAFSGLSIDDIEVTD